MAECFAQYSSGTASSRSLLAVTRIFLYLQNMKGTKLAVTVFFALFLVICIAVHVVGLATHYSDEPVYSHIIHTISYCICLFTLLRPVAYRTLLYSLAAIYPFCYHANCAWMHYSLQGKLSPICIYVVIMMPLCGVWIWRQSNLRA